MYGGRLFQKVAPKTGKARLPTGERLSSGTAVAVTGSHGVIAKNYLI